MFSYLGGKKVSGKVDCLDNFQNTKLMLKHLVNAYWVYFVLNHQVDSAI